MDRDFLLQKEVVKRLLENKKKICFAESCTGGLLSKKITDIPGSSGCMDCGFVTYSNEKKTELLGVKPETLKQYGAVSPQTAYEMCFGARENSGADIGVGITGLAGPDGGTPEKPVGLVFFGICTETVHAVCRLMLDGSRDEVREKTSVYVLTAVLKLLNNSLNINNREIMQSDIL